MKKQERTTSPMTPEECTEFSALLTSKYKVHPDNIILISDAADDVDTPVGVEINTGSVYPFAVWYEVDQTNYGVPTDKVFERLPNGKLRGGFTKD